jgi:replicative DNA helicase
MAFMGELRHIREILEDWLDADLSVGRTGFRRRLPVTSGFVDLDALLGGFKPGDLIVLAARPGMGSSAMAMAFARNAAVEQKATVVVYSLEMSWEQLGQRLLSAEADVESTRLRLGEHTEAEERRIMHAMGVLAGADILINDAPELSADEIGAGVCAISQVAELDLVVIDNLNRISIPTDTSGVFGRSRDTSLRKLKYLAREAGVPVVVLADVSTAVDHRVPHIPRRSDLKHHAYLEELADVVILLYREEYYATREIWEDENVNAHVKAFPSGLAQAIVAKHRNGAVGSVDLRFVHKVAKFEDLMVRDDVSV